MTKNNEEIIEMAVNTLLRDWFVITPISKTEPEGDVWGMDTSSGTIERVKRELKKPIEKVIKEKAKDMISDLNNRLCDDLEYPQKKYAFLLHKKDSKEWKNKHLENDKKQ